MSLDQQYCEKNSCCGNCKAVLKAVTILHFHLPPHRRPPRPAPLTYPGVVAEGRQLNILILTQPPSLFLPLLPPVSSEQPLLLCFKWQL